LHRLDPAARAEVVAQLGEAGVTWLLEGFGVGQAAAEVADYGAAGPTGD
jgi:hypothetical protein